MSHVFISYTRDEVSVARRFAEAFELAGLKVWWDQALRSGEAYDEVTEAALREAKVVVVLWSRRSSASRWVRSEATIAQRQGTLVPVMIEPCERPVMFELVQTADLSDWTGHPDHAGFRAFVTDIRCMVTGECERMTPVELATGAELRLPSKPSIAVLPFADLSGGDDDHFADGMTEEIAIVLSRFSSLFVIAGQSSLTYRGTTKTPQTIARELGVRYLLEGSVRRAGGRVRIAAKLIDALAGEQIWAERFDDRLDDIFDIQDKVATAVAGAIDSTITDAEMKRALTRPTASPSAYELVVRANALLCRHGRKDNDEALELAERASELDPNLAWAIAIQAFCRAERVLHAWSQDPKADRKTALELAGKAERLADNDQLAMAVIAGTLQALRHDRSRAVRLIGRALEMTPGKPFVLFWAGWVAFWDDRYEESLSHFEQAVRLDPRSSYRPFQLSGMGTALLVLGRLEEAHVVLSEALGLVHHTAAVVPLVILLAKKGEVAQANAVLKDAGFRVPFGKLAPRMQNGTMTRLVEEAAAILDASALAAA
jgi:TolB-like protein/Tfp pilus assembly protein PilF